MMVDRLPSAVVARPGKSAVCSALERKRVGHQPPRDAAAQNVEHGVHHLPHRVGPLPAALGIRRDKRTENGPLGIGQIASIA